LKNFGKTKIYPHYLAGLPALSFHHLSSALAGAAMIYPAQALPFIASDAAVAVIRICLLFFIGSHGLGEEPRHVSFQL
jgi:hypothetical protein